MAVEILVVDGRYEPIVGVGGTPAGVVCADDDAPAGVPAIVAGAAVGGALPVTITVPAWATHAELREIDSGRTITVDCQPGGSATVALRTADFGAPAVDQIRLMARAVSASQRGLWTRRHLLWGDPSSTPPPPAAIQYTGALRVTSTWITGAAVTIDETPLPTAPAGVTAVLTFEVYSAAAGGSLLRTDATWPTVTGAVDEHVHPTWRATAPGMPELVIRTPVRYRVTAAPVTAMQTYWTPEADEFERAMAAPLAAYQVNGGNTDNEGVGYADQFAHCPPVLLACEAYAGQTRRIGSKTGGERLLEHVRNWLTGNRAPGGRSGYNAQHEANACGAIAVLRATPSLWGALTVAERTRCDLVMKGLALGSCWIVSAVNPYVTGALSGRERTVRGFKGQSGSVPNYSAPPRLIPFVVDGFLRMQGTSLQVFLTTFDRAAFAAEVLAAGNLGHLYKSYAQDWTVAQLQAEYGAGVMLNFAPGPSEAQLMAALRDGHPGGIYRAIGEGGPYTLAQGHQAFVAEVTRMFSRTIAPGPSTYAGSPLPGRETGPAPWDSVGYGLKVSSPLSGIDETQLRAVLGSRLPDGTTDKSAWAGLPNGGQVGMLAELNDADGGGGGNPALRSEAVYAFHGWAAEGALVAAACITGVVDTAAADWQAIAGRIERGVTDFLYRTRHGHRGYSKGAQDHPNRDWTLTWADNAGAYFATARGVWRMALRQSGVTMTARETG